MRYGAERKSEEMERWDRGTTKNEPRKKERPKDRNIERKEEKEGIMSHQATPGDGLTTDRTKSASLVGY